VQSTHSAPQWVASSTWSHAFAEFPSQFKYPLWHVNAHTPPLQLAVAWFAGQAVPHAPQCVTLDLRFAHTPPSQSTAGAVHSFVHPPFEQTLRVPFEQSFAQSPHVFALSRSTSQPSDGSPLQSATSGAHFAVRQLPSLQLNESTLGPPHGAHPVAVHPKAGSSIPTHAALQIF
jgi:hypothetical protein